MDRRGRTKRLRDEKVGGRGRGGGGGETGDATSPPRVCFFFCFVRFFSPGESLVKSEEAPNCDKFILD
jgi:hypothetical protein